MKRFHVHVGVENLNQSVEFYSKLFGVSPVKLKSDYAKWELKDPRLNFAISTRVKKIGVDHFGIQAEEKVELNEALNRFESAGMTLERQGETTCCYSKSEKAWLKDPTGIPWEAYVNMEDAEVFSEEKGSCCPTSTSKACC